MNRQPDGDIRPTWVEIDLDVFAANVAAIRQYLDAHGKRKSRIAAVVKADAYGHGAIKVARAALDAGADWLAVAFAEEGLALREAGLQCPVLILGWTPPSAVSRAVSADLSLTVPQTEDGRAIAAAARTVGKPARVHVKVDTGMGRLGFSPDEEGVEAVRRLARLDGLQLEGLFTHFSVADEDPVYTRRQLRRYRRFVTALRTRGVDVPIHHAANSAAVLDFPEASFDMVRPGIMLYGVYPTPLVSRSVEVRPFMTWKTRVAQVKGHGPGSSISYGRTYCTKGSATIATLPVGYADGYPRALSNCGEVLIEGHRCRIAGRVCMDQTMVVVPDEAGRIEPGTEAVLLGSDGCEEVTADELAELTDTIAHEIFTGVSKRVPRVFFRGDEALATGEVMHF